MVTMNDELLGHKVVFRSLKRPNQIIEFFVIGGIIKSGAMDFFTEICNWVPTVINNTYAYY